MSDQFKCSFCGSDTLLIDTPYIKPVTHEVEQTFCCRAQARNQEYIQKKYHPVLGKKPDPKDVAKW